MVLRLLTEDVDMFADVGVVVPQVPALVLPAVLPADPLYDDLAAHHLSLPVRHSPLLQHHSSSQS